MWLKPFLHKFCPLAKANGNKIVMNQTDKKKDVLPSYKFASNKCFRSAN